LTLSGLRSLDKSAIVGLLFVVSGERDPQGRKLLVGLSLRKPFFASFMAAAVQRKAIEVECTEAQTAVAPRKAQRIGNYKHGRYTKEVAATRQWLREATQMLRGLNKGPG
jgi:hypothetical protein